MSSVESRECAAISLTARGLVQIDLAALARNYRFLCDTAFPATCAAVVKADAYGLGAERIATRLNDEGCNTFFVATLEEGVRLREALASVTIYILDGVGGNQVSVFTSHSLRPVLNTLDDLRSWIQCFRQTRGSVAASCQAALHIDTGMNRLGLSVSDVREARRLLSEFSVVPIDFLMTHLVCADNPPHPLNRRQIEVFHEVKALFPGVPTSIGNSAGTLLGEDYQGDIARPGIALYGGNPYINRENPMEEVVRLSGRVAQIRDLAGSGTVGYGATYRRAAPGRIATITVGYADGYPRCLGNIASVAIRGEHAPLVGNVSMDSLTADVTEISEHLLQVGTMVDLIGGGMNLDNVAGQAGTVSNEILCGLGKRLPRVYLD